MAMTNFNPNAADDQNGAGTPGTPGSGGGVPAGTTPAGAVPGGPYPWSEDDGFDPSAFLINYNQRYKSEPPILFRDAVIHQTEACLIGKFKPNALLIGPAGVGKTKIAEDLARRIAMQDPSVPDQLQGCTIWELPISNIVAGSGLVGEVERKTQAILQFAQDPANKVILFIDEIHMLIGQNQVYEKIAQIMKPALARGDLRVIGATTAQEAQNLMDDPAFNRRFTRLIVDELSQAQTKEILKRMQIPMFNHYYRKIVINDAVIDEIVSVADEFTTMASSHRPDNAITLLDRAMADAYIRRKVLEDQAKSDPALASALAAMPCVVLSKAQMRETAMRLMTGNNEKTDPDIPTLRNALSIIKGQDETIDYLLDTIERNSLGLNIDSHKPLSFLFTGNSGVGKSEVAKIIAKQLTNNKPITLNMTEYHDPASINRIIGAPAGYIGSDSKAELPFDILETNPYQVILLDEFEKADRSVQRLFMSAFDEGYIKTSRGKTVDFSKAIIIATTNAGHTGVSSQLGFTLSGSTKSDTNMKDLSKFFDTELLNRFKKVLTFNAIDENLFRTILLDAYRRHVAKIKAARSAYVYLPDEMTDDDAGRLTKEHYVAEFGARHINDIIQRHLEDTVMAIRKGTATAISTDTDPASSSDTADADTETHT